MTTTPTKSSSACSRRRPDPGARRLAYSYMYTTSMYSPALRWQPSDYAMSHVYAVMCVFHFNLRATCAGFVNLVPWFVYCIQISHCFFSFFFFLRHLFHSWIFFCLRLRSMTEWLLNHDSCRQKARACLRDRVCIHRQPQQHLITLLQSPKHLW
jgi:hypothetical protein